MKKGGIIMRFWKRPWSVMKNIENKFFLLLFLNSFGKAKEKQQS
jgi:hypothetical protein